MALQITTDFHGLLVPAGYIRVERVASASKTEFRAFCELYASLEAATCTDRPRRSLDSFVVDFIYDLDSGLSVHAQAYAALKARPEFASAVDA